MRAPSSVWTRLARFNITCRVSRPGGRTSLKTWILNSSSKSWIKWYPSRFQLQPECCCPCLQGICQRKQGWTNQEAYRFISVSFALVRLLYRQESIRSWYFSLQGSWRKLDSSSKVKSWIKWYQTRFQSQTESCCPCLQELCQRKQGRTSQEV